METILPAYKSVGERRYRETSGLYWEDFEPGEVFEHRPGRTVLDTDNVYFTLLTLNVQQVHFDAAYAARTEWKKLLVDSTFHAGAADRDERAYGQCQSGRKPGMGQCEGHTPGIRRRHAICREHGAKQARIQGQTHTGHRDRRNSRHQSRRC
jgi:hypothetical protein